jgi:uncharacterized protein (UPF0276 family)
MKFAINYSKPAAELFNAGKIQFDLFKCPEWPELLETVGTHFPMYFHFCLLAGKGNVKKTDMNFVTDMMNKTNTKNINIHLGPDVKDFDGMVDHTQDPQQIAVIGEAMLEDIAFVAQRFGKDRVVLENCPWSTRPEYRIPAAVLRADVIAETVRRSGCSLLLDIAHALLASKWLGQDVHDYLKSLPWETLKEIHVSGTRQLTNGLWTDHFSMRDEDWQVTQWVFDRIHQGDWPRPEMVSFEYGGVGERFEARTDPAMIAEQTPRLYEIVMST